MDYIMLSLQHWTELPLDWVYNQDFFFKIHLELGFTIHFLISCHKCYDISLWQIFYVKKKKNVQPSGNNNKTSLGKVLFPPRNYRTEAPVEVLDTPFHAHRKTSAKQFLANYSNNSRHFWQGFFSFPSLNMELLKSSQIVEMDKEQKQKTQQNANNCRWNHQRQSRIFSAMGNNQGRL